jgi:hypothetical protein
VVRGPAALLAACLAGVAYLSVAGALPALPSGDAEAIVCGGCGLVLVAAVALALVDASDGTTFGLAVFALGVLLLVAVLDAAGAGAAAVVPEALLAASAGILFARALATPAVVVAVPVFVALIDLWSVASGPSSHLIRDRPAGLRELTFDLPAWGGGAVAGRLGLSDVVFLAMFAAWGWRSGFRRGATAIGLTAGLLASLALGVALDRAIPALPLLAVGFLLPNADRAAALFRRSTRG